MEVTFSEEQQPTRTPRTNVSGLYALVIRWGLAKDQRSAAAVLGITAASLLLLMICLIVFAPGTRNQLSPQEYVHDGQITVPPAP